MTKGEIVLKVSKLLHTYNTDEKTETKASFFTEAIVQLIDQETAKLREENEEKQKALDYCHKKMALMVNEIERLKSDLSLLEIVVNDSNTLIKSQDKELAELKAKHKDAVINAFNVGVMRSVNYGSTNANEYYKDKFENK